MKVPGSTPNSDPISEPDKPINSEKNDSEAPVPTQVIQEIVQVQPSPQVMRKRVFGEDDVVSALQGISRALREKGVQDAEIRIYGSVALICSFPGSRRLTTDIDVIPSSPIVMAVAEEVGKSLFLPEDWLNEDVRTYERSTFRFVEHEIPGCENLKILGLTPPSLFAMKCFAGRDRKDIADLTFLADKLGLHSLKEADAIFEQFYPGEGMVELAMISLLEHFEGRFE